MGRSRHREFRKLFGLPEDETLIEDYSCALHKGILCQGRLYVSRNFVSFHTKVIKETKLMIPFSTIVAIDKRNTALLIPNAIEVSARTPGADEVKTYFFTSLMNRDSTFNLLEKLWELRRERSGTTDIPASDSPPSRVSFGDADSTLSLPPVFGLPSDEIVLHRFPCVNRSLMQGMLYVTPRYLCFDTLAHTSDAHRVVVLLDDVVAVKKSQFAKFLPGSGHSLQISLRSGDVMYFSGFSDRDAAFAALVRDTKAAAGVGGALGSPPLAAAASLAAGAAGPAPAEPPEDAVLTDGALSDGEPADESFASGISTPSPPPVPPSPAPVRLSAAAAAAAPAAGDGAGEEGATVTADRVLPPLDAGMLGHRIDQYVCFLPRPYRKVRCTVPAGAVAARQFVYNDTAVRLTVMQPCLCGESDPVQCVAERVAASIAARDEEYVLLSSAAASRRSVGGASVPSSEDEWTCWRVRVRTIMRDIGVLVLRRCHLPPLGNTEQDVVLVLRGGPGLYPAAFDLHLDSLGDGLTAAAAEYDLPSIKAAVWSLGAPEEVVIWAHRRFGISPPASHEAKVFCARIVALMEVEALRIRGVDELAAHSDSLEDPFDVVTALNSSGKMNHIPADELGVVNDVEWEARVARYLALYVSRLSDIKLTDLVELPLIPSARSSTASMVYRLVDYFLHMHEPNRPYDEHVSFHAKLRDAAFVDRCEYNEAVLVKLLLLPHSIISLAPSPDVFARLLLRVLRTGSPRARVAGARECARAALSPTHRAALVTEGLVQQLAGLLNDASAPEPLLLPVLRALANVTADNTVAKELLAGSGGLAAVRSRLLAVTPVQLEATAALCTIMKNCADAPLRTERVVGENGIACLSRVLHQLVTDIPGAPVNSDVVAAAAGALWNVAVDRRYRAQAGAASMPSVLVALLQRCSSDRALEKVAGAVAALCSDEPAAKARFGRARAVEALCVIATRVSVPDSLLAVTVRALLALSGHPSNADTARTLLRPSGPALLEALQHASRPNSEAISDRLAALLGLPRPSSATSTPSSTTADVLTASS